MTQEFNIEALVTHMQDTMGINPFNVYCQLTGKPVGRMSPDELEPFLNGDVEEVADDLFVRIIASMRPSIHWNVMREDSLKIMAVKRPVETMCYLLNRLFQSEDWNKRGMALRLDDQHMRIKLYDFIWNWPDREGFESLYSMLIEIDAKMNLSQQSIDLRPVDFMLFPKESFEIIEKFYADCMKKWTRSQKAEEDARRWYKGNSIARPAFFDSWIKAKPETKAKATVRVKKEADSAVDALLDAVMAEAAESAYDVTVEMLPRPAKATPIKSIKSKSVTGKVPSFLTRKAV